MTTEIKIAFPRIIWTCVLNDLISIKVLMCGMPFPMKDPHPYSSDNMPIPMPRNLVKDISDFIRLIKVNPWIRTERPDHYWTAHDLLRRLERYLAVYPWRNK